MGYTARWGPKGFIISPTKVVSLEDFATSFAIKSDTNGDTSGTPPTNTQGMELQPLTLKTRYARALGTDPIGQIEEWRAQVGKANTFFLGGKPFGPKFMLKQADVSETSFTPDGTMIACTISLTFEEYSSATDTNAAATASTADAMSAKPSTADKAALK